MPYSESSVKVTKSDCVATRFWQNGRFSTVFHGFVIKWPFLRLFALTSRKCVSGSGVEVYLNTGKPGNNGKFMKIEQKVKGHWVGAALYFTKTVFLMVFDCFNANGCQ